MEKAGSMGPAPSPAVDHILLTTVKLDKTYEADVFRLRTIAKATQSPQLSG